MNTTISDAVTILHIAIAESDTQEQLTSLACEIHQVSISGSDTETELIRRVAARQIEIELRDMELADQLKARWQDMQNNWAQN